MKATNPFKTLGIGLAALVVTLGFAAAAARAQGVTEDAGAIGPTGQTIDRVVAVVGDQIILFSDVQQQMQAVMMTRNMDERTPPDQLDILFREVLHDMVNEELMLIKAERDSIKVDQRKVDDQEREQIASMRAQYKTDEEFVAALAEYGFSEQQLHYMVRQMVYKRVLQDTFLGTIEQGITVSPKEIEQWIEAKKDSLPQMPEEFRISHILLRSSVSAAQKEETRKRLAAIRDRILAGEDFAKLAATYSEDTGSAPSGGDLGYFTRDEMVPEFSQVAFSTKQGEVSDIFETSLGYHILKVEDIRGNQVNARHILLLMKPTAQDEEATIQRLKTFRADILAGKATFEDIAKQYSEDETSRDLGGRLQWQTQEYGIPELIDQAEKIKVGEISEPFNTKYGYHIIRYDNYRPAHTLNSRDDNQIVRQMVINEKRIAEMDRVLNRMRSDVFIRVNLE